MKPTSDDHLTQLRVVSVPAKGERCSECGGTADGKLLIFSTMRGQRERVHDGKFCSKLCHDRFHGLAPRSEVR